jgi:hypothetical protein
MITDDNFSLENYLNESISGSLSVHGQGWTTHEGNNDESQDEDSIGDTTPGSQRSRREFEPLHDVTRG